MKQVVVYPRGFLGYDIGLPVQREKSDINDLVRSMRNYRGAAKSSRTVISNQDIDALYLGIVRGERTTKTFEYREKILKAVMHAFGTDSFYEWCALQEQSPYFTDLHRRFLNDTFRFIQFGQRQMSVRSWISLIRVREPSVEDTKTPYLYQDFFNVKDPALFQRPFSVEAAVTAWTSQPAGFMDMIQSVRVFFGDTQHL